MDETIARLVASLSHLENDFQFDWSAERKAGANWQVTRLVAARLLNKQVGGELNISEITVKAHRGQVMRKMKADSLADLVTMAARLRR